MKYVKAWLIGFVFLAVFAVFGVAVVWLCWWYGPFIAAAIGFVVVVFLLISIPYELGEGFLHRDDERD